MHGKKRSGADNNPNPGPDAVIPGSSVQPKPNPLLIDLIFANTIKYLDDATLFTLRLVCPLWDKIAFKELAKRRTLYLRINTKDPETVAKLRALLAAAFDAGREYNRFWFRYPCILETEEMQRWMELYGKHIHCLFLTEKPATNNPQEITKFKSKFTNLEYGMQISTLKLIFTRWCPNLNTLYIPTPQFSPEEEKNTPDLECPIVPRVKLDNLCLGSKLTEVLLVDVEKMASKVFELCQEIKTLTLVRDGVDGGDDDLDTFYYPPDCFSQDFECFRTLSEIDLGNYTVQVKNLVSLGWRQFDNLKILRISPTIELRDTADDRLAALDSLLEKFRPQLTTLELTASHTLFWDMEDPDDPEYEKENRQSVNISLLKLFNLERANDFTKLGINFRSWTPDSFNFLLNFKSLKSLTLTFPNGEDESLHSLLKIPHRVRLESLEKLKLHSVLDSESVQSLVKLFPNLKELRVSCFKEKAIDEESFKIFTKFTQLATLTISVPSVAWSWWSRQGLLALSQFSESFMALKQLNISATGSRDEVPLEALDNMLKLSGTLVPMLREFQNAPEFTSLNLTGFKLKTSVYDNLKRACSRAKVKVLFIKCKRVTLTKPVQEYDCDKIEYFDCSTKVPPPPLTRRPKWNI